MLPPLFAFLLYILTTYLLLPYYRRFRSYSTYTVLPSSPDSNAFAHGLLYRMNNLLGRRRDSANGAESLLGDEELEEGFADISSDAISRQDTIGRMVEDGRGNERRLSHELERGFRDSSDEEDDARGRERR
jgi:hypothetical protein